MTVTRDGDGFVVDAAVLAEAFELDAASVRKAMAAGRITTRCETGLEADAGRWRLTFRYGGRTLRLVVDAEGTILSRSRITAAPRPSHGNGVGNKVGDTDPAGA